MADSLWNPAVDSQLFPWMQQGGQAQFPLGQSGPANNPPGGMQSAAPSNDVWSGINPQLAQIYQQHGIMNPGASGSGFTDAQYWNDKPSQWARLGSDLEGTGPDQPGPGDAGNRSGGGGSGLGGDLSSLLQILLGRGITGGMNQGAQPYNPHYQGNRFMNSNLPNGPSIYNNVTPYNNLSQNQGFNNYYGNQPMIGVPTAQQQAQVAANPNMFPNFQGNSIYPTQSNGTLVGTQFSSAQPSFMQQGNQQVNRSYQGNSIMRKPSYSPFNTGGQMSSQQTPMGAPTFYNTANNVSQSQSNKPNQFSYSNQTGMSQ